MYRHALHSITVVLGLAPAILAQSDTLATLEIATENVGIYRHDVFDATRVATQPGPITPLPIRTFMHATWIADIVAVNGIPAKGTMTVRSTYVALNPNPSPGTGVADTINSAPGDWIFDIQRVFSNYAGMKSDLAPWLADATINRDRNLRLQYLAGMGFNLYQSEAIYADMLQYSQWPNDLFVGSDATKQQLRAAILKMQGK